MGFLLSCLFLFTVIPNALSQDDEPLVFAAVVKVDSVSQDELYQRGLVWFTKTFSNANDVIQLKEENTATIVAKAEIPYTQSFISGSTQTKGKVSFTYSLYFKEGRYKYEISDFYHVPYGGSSGSYSVGQLTNSESCPNPKKMAAGWSDKVWNDVKNQVKTEMTMLAKNMQFAMSQPLVSQKDDW